MSKNNKPTKYAIHANEWQQLRIRQLLANLCYVEITDEQAAKGWENAPLDRIAEMGEYKITPEMVELSGMAEEAKFYLAIEATLGQGVTPTFEAVQETLAYIVNSPERAEEITNRVKSHRTIDREIYTVAVGIGQHMKTEYLAYALHDIADSDVRGPYGDYAEKFEKVMDRITALAPLSKQHPMIGYDDLWSMVQNYAREAVQRRKEGRTMGPTYPWQYINKLLGGGMEKGDLHLWTGASKAGKTTFASEIGRHIAFKQKDYMVLQLHLETNPLTLAAREVCREFKVQSKDIREGLIDPDSDYWKSKFQAMEARIARKCGTWDDSRYLYKHCPGLTFTELEGYVRVCLAKAEARGLELVVILDYYQEMEWYNLPGVQNETQGLNVLATKLKTLADEYGIYLIVFAQEADDEADRKGRTTPYMAKKIVKRAQAHFRILRGPEDQFATAVTDNPIDSNQKDEFGRMIPINDGLRTEEYPEGRPMYWHLEGQPHSYTRVHLCRSNNSGTGIQWLMIANGYFLIQESMPPDK